MSESLVIALYFTFPGFLTQAILILEQDCLSAQALPTPHSS